MSDKREKDLFEKGTECYKNKEYNKAKKLLEEVTQINDKNAEAFFLLANIFHIKGELGKAIKGFNKVLAIDPYHTDASVSLSILYNDIGKYKEAKKIFDTANDRVKKNISNGGGGIEDDHINKKFSLKHYELADLYMTYNRFDEALFEYNKCISLDTNNLEARIKVAKVYAKKGFMTKAFEELRRVKNEFPSYMSAGVALGVLHYGSGRILEAQSEWGRVLAKDPGNTEAKMYINLSKTATETTVNLNP